MLEPGCSGEVCSMTDAAEVANIVVTRTGERRDLRGKMKMEWKMKPRFLAEEVGR